MTQPVPVAAEPTNQDSMSRRVRRALRRDPYGLEPKTTTIDGRQVRSFSAGRVDALPEIVLLPGLGAPGYLAPWARESSAWTIATVLDLPGWRGGRARGCIPTLQDVAVTTARWLEVTDRRNVILLGHSTGAQSVLRTALLLPERIATVVLAGPTFAPDVRSVPALLRRVATTIPREVADEVPAVFPSYFRSGGLPLLRFLRSALGDRPEDLILDLKVPAFVFTGQRDGFAPPAWGQHLAGLASAPFVVLPGAHNACFPYAHEADAALHTLAKSLTPGQSLKSNPTAPPAQSCSERD